MVAYRSPQSQRHVHVAVSLHPVVTRTTRVVQPTTPNCARFTAEDFFAMLRNIPGGSAGQLARELFEAAAEQASQNIVRLNFEALGSAIFSVAASYGVTGEWLVVTEDLSRRVRSTSDLWLPHHFHCGVDRQLAPAMRNFRRLLDIKSGERGNRGNASDSGHSLCLLIVSLNRLGLLKDSAILELFKNLVHYVDNYAAREMCWTLLSNVPLNLFHDHATGGLRTLYQSVKHRSTTMSDQLLLEHLQPHF